MADWGRRDALAALGVAGAGLALPGWAQARPLPLVRSFPQKGAMLLQRSRAPLLETPFELFDQGIITPNDRFFVRWHYDDIPLVVDTNSFRLKVDGAVNGRLAFSIPDLLKLRRVELTAINQCSGNSRAYFSPRVPGAQWGHGAMGNARWTGVRLKDVLDRAGVKPEAKAVRFAGLDRPPGDAPWFAKSLDLDHARDGEVMIAFAMNGQALPMLNGFPIRLVVPGWYSTYWIKALDHIEVLDAPDDNFWMAKAYQIPATPRASVAPGTKEFPKLPINKMLPRSFITSRGIGPIKAGAPLHLRGIAMGGASGVAAVELSVNGGAWQKTVLGKDHGKYSFRGWEITVTQLAPGPHRIAVRATNTSGDTQLPDPIWNPGGYMFNTIETITVHAA